MEIKWLLEHPGCGPEEVDDGEEQGTGGECSLANSRMIRAIGRALEINLARLDELESTLNLMHEYTSTLEGKITEARVERVSMKMVLKDLKGHDADQMDSESDKEESGDCRGDSAGGERIVAKRKAGEVLISSGGERHKAGCFESDSGVSSAVPINVEPDDAHIPPDEDMKDRGLLDGSSEIKAEHQSEGDIIMGGAAVKTVNQGASEFVDGNVDGKEASQPQPTKQKRSKTKHNPRNRGGESSKASGAAAALLAEKVARVRDRWAYEAGVEHSTFSSMRRDGAAE
ncbi:hypothetical protein P167DRAFT_25370 [Morchella conica CCBAS932]|uniref:Uncharacterized protein n=1 Tax=Morchella conica CCBAS932 TaxID=1392247 RepID=A0A3N4K8M9_9PEZI|nr:hypothetical protein P167DRAFT_25370 [Morchella conica CCBAS932]